MKEYKVVLYRENILSSIILGSAKTDPERFSRLLNANATEGWRVVAMDKEIRRTLFFWKREAFVVIMERDKKE